MNATNKLGYAFILEVGSATIVCIAQKIGARAREIHSYGVRGVKTWKMDSKLRCLVNQFMQSDFS
ncbi:hypothetical protein N7540_007506 [Penicillium herquei]|nr:hypothetical protein N7540_007506 [Penicillium herquei]